MPSVAERSLSLNDHELSWMFVDAASMFQQGRKYSAMLLLLCAVDALAKLFDPDNEKSGERYREFLKSRLPAQTRVQNFNIQVPMRNEMFRIEYILYKYLRNPIIHEGAHLDITHPTTFAVQVNWQSNAPSVHVDNDHNRVVFGGDWIINIVGGVVKDAIKEDLLRRPNGI